MQEQYKNREWLYNKYWNEELSKHQIAKLCNIGYTTIHYWMVKFNILRRSHKEANCTKKYLKLISRKIHLASANHCRLAQNMIDWIDGELLGDACLRNLSPFSAQFNYASKYLEYIKYVKNVLESFGIEAGRIYKRYHKDMDCYTYSCCSRHYVELLPVYRRWYPKGKKVIPKDIRLTPITLRQHYIGDGHLKHGRWGRPRIILATYGFPIIDVKWLMGRLNKLGFKVTRWASNNAIAISVYSTKDFLNYIGECPVKCYQYKFEY